MIAVRVQLKSRLQISENGVRRFPPGQGARENLPGGQMNTHCRPGGFSRFPAALKNHRGYQLPGTVSVALPANQCVWASCLTARPKPTPKMA